MSGSGMSGSYSSGPGHQFDRCGAAITVAWQPIETAPKDGTRILVFCLLFGKETAVCVEWRTSWRTGEPSPDWLRDDGTVFPNPNLWVSFPTVVAK